MASIEERFVKHPWQALGTAFLFGAWLGLEAPVPRNRIARAMLAMIGSMTLRAAREVAMHELLGRLTNQIRAPAPDTVVS